MAHFIIEFRPTNKPKQTTDLALRTIAEFSRNIFLAGCLISNRTIIRYIFIIDIQSPNGME